MEKESIHLGDVTATRLENEHITSCDKFSVIGSGDTTLTPEFLTKDEADKAFVSLNVGGDINYQQWYHMPDKKGNLLPLSRLKIAMADTDNDGWTPHYRFPINNQDHHGVFSFSSSPTVNYIREKLVKTTGIPFNHAVVLLYRDGNDCIGFHKDKTLDLSLIDPIVSISLGQERSYLLRDDIRNPTHTQELKLSHGCMLSLGSVTNKEWYHSIPTEKDSNLSTRISLTFRVVTTFKNNVSGELKGQGSLYKDFNWPEKLGGTHVNHSD